MQVLGHASPIIASKSIVIADCAGNVARLTAGSGRGHTGSTMASKARALELPSPLPAQLLAFGLVLVTIILILPR